MSSRSKSLGKHSSFLPNIDFYTGKKSRTFFDLEIFRKKKGDYKFLEGNHAFIQWIFPNNFSSQFNYDSYALTLEEAEEFRKNPVIAENLIDNYKIMFEFYGINFDPNDIDEPFKRTSNYKERYRLCFFINLHNHLRIRRILAHLNVVGFRKFAIKLVDYFDSETKEKDALGSISNVVEIWKRYGKIDESNEKQKEILINMCFPSMDVDKGWKLINLDSIYFSIPKSEDKEKKRFVSKSENKEEKNQRKEFLKLMQLPQENYDVNQVCQAVFEFFIEVYKETSVLSQKLIEIEIIDLSKKNFLNLFNDINNSFNFFDSDSHILANDCLSSIIKIRETQFITDFRKLQNYLSFNDKILRKMINILKTLQGLQLYYVEVKDKRIQIIEIKTSQDESEVCFDLKSNSKNSFYGVSLFVIPFQLPKNFDFKNFIDFCKIWGIYNGSINIIAKYLSSKTLKELFKSSKPLDEHSDYCERILDADCFSNNKLEFEKKIKIFNVCHIFSFYDEKDIDLIDLFQNLDHSTFLFSNERQYFTELNKKEITENFLLTFAIEDNNYQSLSKSIIFDQLHFKMEIILGITEKIKGKLFCFKFKNKKLLFNKCKNRKGNFLNIILKESLQSFSWSEFGLQIDFDKKESEFMIVGSLNTIKARKGKLADFSIILVIQFEHIGIFDFIDNMNNISHFLVFEFHKLFFFIFENLRKKNGFDVLISRQENKLKCILNEEVPRICSSIMKINEMFQRNPIDINHLKKKMLNSILFKPN